jgi:hypothetical protein
LLLNRAPLNVMMYVQQSPTQKRFPRASGKSGVFQLARATQHLAAPKAPFTAELVVSTALIAGRITTMQRTRSTLTMLINRVTVMMRTRNLYSELD